MRTKALIVGSIVYDEIFSIKGNIKHEIPLNGGRIDSINLMFTAKNKARYFGGTAGNIAYGLGQLKENPLIFSCVGQDFMPYEQHLIENGAISKVHKDNNYSFCATFYGISDEAGQQIGIFQPNSYGENVEKVDLKRTLTQEDFDSLKVAILAPGTAISTLNHLSELRDETQGKVFTILDPGQELSISFNKEILRVAIPMSDAVIGNETEIAQFEQLFNLPPEKILRSGCKMVIETKGQKGAIIHTKEGKQKVPAVKAKRFLEATGAGDAFRAGLIKGLLNDWPIEKAAFLGAKMGALNVTGYGGQGYRVEDKNSLFQ